jgi:hypothetical protein
MGSVYSQVPSLIFYKIPHIYPLKGKLMLRKLIKYTDWDGVPREEYFNFNMTPAEFIIMQANYPGGDLPGYFKKCADQAMETPKPLVELFLDLLSTTYGTREAGSNRFIKSPAVWEEFRQGPAFSPFFMSLLENAEAASDFVNAVFKDNLPTVEKKPELKLVSLPKEDAPVFKMPISIAEQRLSEAMGFTPKPASDMSPDEMVAEITRLRTTRPNE